MQFGLLVALLLIIQGIDSQVTFTGDAVYDFFPARLSQDAQKAYLEIYNGPSELGVTAARMRACKNLTTGWDVESVYMQYDYFNDILFVGVNCFSTCGDPDGDGFPMTTLSGTTVSLPAGCPPGAPLSAPKLFDYYNYAGPEALSLVFWPEPPLLPSDYQNLGNLTQASKVFYPTFVVGVKTTGIDCTTYYKIFTDLDAYIFQEDDDCVNLPTPYPSGSACEASHAARINVPINSFADVTVNQQSNLAGNAWSGRNIPALTRFATLPPGISKCTTCDNCTNTFLMYPNITMPDVEFSLQKFSKYYNFSFIPGIEPIEFAFMLYTGSPSDGFGEEIVFPALFSIPCTIQDTCGVCNGDNSTCKDCHGIVLGTGQYDRCGICDGANACVDCANITNGNTKYDRCGVCGGNNDCVDCANITFGTAKYDRCGVCNGNNACVDCANVTFGTSKYDRCGVCNGNNSCVDCANVTFGTSKYDRCGVCNGNNSCVDCANVTNGNGQYDRCGVCNGNNGCVDCANVTNGNSRYDRCGVCNGNNACVDCANNTNGNSKYDRCGVCNGNNGCVDCANITNGNSHYDRCGVCNGNNACVDCANVTNGNSHYDRCGVCGGNNGCVDCANITNGNSQYDRCGVCNGNNGCVDCANITRGNGVYDQCGVCNGNDACIDCTGTPGNRTYDLCGVCAGNNSCIDCLGRPHGEATYDRCGVCNGNDACLDCLGVINGTAVYDRCGVCDGNNASIYTFEFEFNGDDSWIELANRTANHGCDDTLHVAWNRSRTVINFDDIRETIMKHGGIFNQTEILNATIFMNLTSVTGGWNDSQLAIHMIDGQFTESEVSWECRDVTCPGCCDQWRMISLPPIVKADFERVPTELKNVTVGQTGTIGWNVTSDVVKYFQEGPTCGGISWLIKKHCEYDPGYATFCSGEGGCCPTLKIYVRSTCPLPPTPQPTPPCPDQEQLYQAMP